MDRRLPRLHSFATGTHVALLATMLLAACGESDSSSCIDACGGSAGSKPYCGDDTCDLGETAANCQVDCGSYNCGDGDCTDAELCGTCADDCGACTGAPIDVVRGPYLQSGTSESVIVRWRTAEPSPSVVAFGLGNRLTTLVHSPDPTTEHAVAVNGLEPDSEYRYAFGAPESDLWKGGVIVTPPAIGTPRDTRIWVIGDAGTANDDQRAVRDAYLAHTGTRGTDLMLMLGDNAYPSGSDAEYQAAVFDMYSGVLNSSVLWPALGERDAQAAYFDMFTLPTQAEAGGVASGTEAYYSFDYAHIHFVCLDSYDPDTSGEMNAWLNADLYDTEQPWIIAFWHHPPYSKGSHDSDTEPELVYMREHVVSLLESWGVDLVLGSHSNSYERSFYLHAHLGTSDRLMPSMLIDAGDGRENGDGPYVRPAGSWIGAVYVVAGSAGQIGGGTLDHPAMYMSVAELGSVVVDVDGASMKVSFVDAAATVRDWFTIVKQ